MLELNFAQLKDIFYIMIPVGILIVGALLIIGIDLIKNNLPKGLYVILGLVTLGLSFISLFSFQSSFSFASMLIDGVAILSSAIILVVSAFFMLFSLSKQDFHESKMPEFFAFFLFATAGFMFMCMSDNLILIFIGLETGSLALYALIAMHNRLKAIDAAIKYFTMGALASGFFVFSALIFYALSGNVEIHNISEALFTRNLEPLYGILAAAVFLLAALGFKTSIIPFHTWTPDVYEGSTSQMAGYMSIVPKVAAFVVLMRIFEMLSNIGIAWVDFMLYFATILTMTLANIMALIQKDVKRMLAFSSISHAGFLLAAILIGSNQANSAFFLYWIMFSIANTGAFGVLWISRNKQPLWDKRFEHPFEKFSGLIKISPLLACLMALFMISLAGIPPFSLFWGKLFLMGSAVNSGYFGLAVIMAINSAIAIYYYLKLIVFMFLKEPISKDNKVYFYNSSNSLKVIIGFTSIASILAIFLIDPLWQNILNFLAMSNLWK